MRFGMSGCFLPDNLRDVSPKMCREVRRHGFSGIFTRFRNNDPLTTARSDAVNLKSILADEGIRLFQTTGYWQCLIAPDERTRGEAVRVLQAALRLAGWMGARGVDTGPGSMNPSGPWWPHPDNFTAQAKVQLIKSLKECASAAEDAGVFLSLECHQLVTLNTPEIAREVFEDVGSPSVRCDYDSANWIDLTSIYDTGRAINHHFDVLGEHIVSAHAKDLCLENRFALHLQDGSPGKGLVDFATLFQRLEALSPDYPVIAEGNSTEELPAVGALFHSTAKQLGLRVLDTRETA